MDGEYYPFSGVRIGIFWDFENCPPPSRLNGCEIGNRIRRLGQHYGSVVLFKAYLDQSVTLCTKQMRSQLQSSGVSLTDCPRPDTTRKDVADKMILADMMAFAYDNPPPSVMILISGDKDFAYAISVLKSQLYSVILVHRGTDVSLNLVTQPDIVIDGSRLFGPGWEDTLAHLPELFDRKTALHRLQATGLSKAQHEDDAVSVQHAKEEPSGAALTDIKSNGLKELNIQSPVALTAIDPELESEEVGGILSDSVTERHQLPPEDISEPVDPIIAPTPRAIPASTESVHCASPADEGPPPIPPRPPGYPSAKVVRSGPLVPYPETVAESSEDELPQSNATATGQDPNISQVLRVAPLPAKPDPVPALTSPSNSTASSSSLKEIPEVFIDLVEILDSARCMGIEYLNPETVEQMVLHRNPDVMDEANIKWFGTYLKLASDQGIVEYIRSGQGVRLKM